MSGFEVNDCLLLSLMSRFYPVFNIEGAAGPN